MAYEKNTWKTGDIVTSEKLNHIEEGIEAGGGSGGGGAFYVNITENSSGELVDGDKTGAEIGAALEDGLDPVLIVTNQYGGKTYYRYYSKYMTDYVFTAVYVGSGNKLFADTINYGTNYRYKKEIS